MNPPQLFKLATNSFIFRNEKLLILKRSDAEDFLPGYWETAGGGVDEGESVEQGLIREVKEEAGLSINPRKLIGYFEYVDGHGQPTVNLNFLCEMVDPLQEPNVSSDEMAEARWIAEDELTTLHMTDTMKNACRKAFDENR